MSPILLLIGGAAAVLIGIATFRAEHRRGATRAAAIASLAALMLLAIALGAIGDIGVSLAFGGAPRSGTLMAASAVGLWIALVYLLTGRQVQWALGMAAAAGASTALILLAILPPVGG